MPKNPSLWGRLLVQSKTLVNYKYVGMLHIDPALQMPYTAAGSGFIGDTRCSLFSQTIRSGGKNGKHLGNKDWGSVVEVQSCCGG